MYIHMYVRQLLSIIIKIMAQQNFNIVHVFLSTKNQKLNLVEYGAKCTYCISVRVPTVLIIIHMCTYSSTCIYSPLLMYCVSLKVGIVQRCVCEIWEMSEGVSLWGRRTAYCRWTRLTTAAPEASLTTDHCRLNHTNTHTEQKNKNFTLTVKTKNFHYKEL